jgi:hypothetical protein
MLLKNSLNNKVQDFISYNTIPRSRSSIWFSFATALASAQLSYILVGTAVVPVIFAIMSHEFAHYVYSKSNNGVTYYPIFIPFVIAIIGLTSSSNLKDKDRATSAIVGFMYGSLAILLALLFNIINITFVPTFLLLLLAFEIFFNLIGSDGKKYRKYK